MGKKDKLSRVIHPKTPIFEYNKITSDIFIGTNQCCRIHFNKELVKNSVKADLSLEENKIDKELKFNVLKTIVGFMNSNGGTLIIGVDDEHQIIGMKLDYKANWKGNKDGFILDFRECLESSIGINNYNRYIDLNFELIGDKEVCVVKVEKSFEYIYLRKNNKKVLYVRLGNRTKPLDDPEEIIEYIEEDKK